MLRDGGSTHYLTAAEYREVLREKGGRVYGTTILRRRIKQAQAEGFPGIVQVKTARAATEATWDAIIARYSIGPRGHPPVPLEEQRERRRRRRRKRPLGPP